jgi:hypothetical protein
VSSPPIQNFQNWQPSGCLLHEYVKKDIIPCFQERRLLLIGDSTIRQIFWAIARRLGNERAREGMLTKSEDHMHENIEFVSNNVRLQFIWDPWLNSTSLSKELVQFERLSLSTVMNLGQLNGNSALVLIGVPGLWYAKYGSDRYLEDFEKAISSIITTAPSARAEATIDGYPRENMLLFAPIQEPMYSLLSPSRAISVTPTKIDKMQETLRNVSTLSRAKVLWSYSLMTSDIPELYDNTGLHVLETVADRKANVLLNLYCNPSTRKGSNLYDRSCCNAYRDVVQIQRAMWFAGLLVFPVMAFYGQKGSSSPIPHFRLRPGLLLSMAVFSWVVSLCYVADRTHLFEKANKQFELKQFIGACVAIGILGLATVRQNTYHGQQRKLGINYFYDDGFLSRDQTYEWKGWMQAIILLYHYTGGSKALWAYKTIRILVASYLFMTGYGHTQYFLMKGDFSLRRVTSVLVRLNLLGGVLPFMMRTNYLFYYFTPLVSFWFLVVYFTLRIYYQHNTAPRFLLCKIGVSSMLVTGFIHIPGMLEFLFDGLKFVFHISWTVDEWRFRVGLDMNIVYIGMLCAIIGFHQAQGTPTVFSTSSNTLLKHFHTNASLASLILTISSAFLLTIFFTMIRTFPNKYDYNYFQPYISFIPILSYIILRNSHRQLRNHHSVVFAWLGKCSLETYILQYHIWLAGDTHGLLRTGLPWKWIDTAILTSIFLWLSWRVEMATQTISARIVGSGDEQKLHEIQSVEPRESEKSTTLLLISTSKGSSNSWWREDLRLRLAIILLTMWLLNITYV